MNDRRGLTLVELLIGMSILGIVSYGLVSMFSQFTKWSAKNDAADLASEQIRLTGLQLQKFLEGTRTFQGLSLRVPATTLSCDGSGFCILPDKDINGADSKGNDVLYVVSQIPLATQIRLGADYLGAAGFQARSVDGTTELRAVLGKEDLLVVSNVQASEMAQVVGNAPSATTGIIPIGFVPTYGGVISARYLAGDALAKARITAVGFDPVTKEIKLRDVQSGQVRTLATKMAQFSVGYELPDSTLVSASCPKTATGAFQRNWVSINAIQCYKGITKIQTTYAAQSSLGLKIGTYVFKTAI